MPFNCVVPVCTSSTRVCNANPVKFPGSFHSFPRDEKRLKIWLTRIGIKSFRKSDKICSEHFVDEDFVISRARAERIGYELKNVLLTKDAIPSLKLKPNEGPSKPVKERRSLAAIKRMNLETIRLYEEKERLEKEAIEEKERLEKATQEEKERLEKAAKEEEERLENEKIKDAILSAYDPSMAYAGWEGNDAEVFS